MTKITGKSFYSYATKTNSTGKYASNKYEVSIIVDTLEGIATDLLPLFKQRLDKNNNIIGYTAKCKSLYPFKQYDKNANELAEPVAIPNDTVIELAVEVETNEKYPDKPFLSCKGIRFVNDTPEAYNPFKN